MITTQVPVGGIFAVPAGRARLPTGSASCGALRIKCCKHQKECGQAFNVGIKPMDEQSHPVIVLAHRNLQHTWPPCERVVGVSSVISLCGVKCAEARHQCIIHQLRQGQGSQRLMSVARDGR